MKDKLINALDEALKQEVIKLYCVLLHSLFTEMSIDVDRAIDRFAKGVSNAIDAYGKAAIVIDGMTKI